MPKVYTQIERNNIRNRLKKEAVKLLSEYGIRRTTVDKLVESADIPKGTFYIFYNSKEILFYELLTDELESAKSELKKIVQNHNQSKDEIVESLYQFLRKTSKNPLIKVIYSKEMELISKKIPNGLCVNYIKDTNTIFRNILKTLCLNNDYVLDTFCCALHTILQSMIMENHSCEVVSECTDEAYRMIIKGLLLQL